MGKKYQKVWVEEDGSVWEYEPTKSEVALWGPFTKGKVVPRDAIVIEKSELTDLIDQIEWSPNYGELGEWHIRTNDGDLEAHWDDVLCGVALYVAQKRRSKKGKKK